MPVRDFTKNRVFCLIKIDNFCNQGNGLILFKQDGQTFYYGDFSS